MIKANNLVNYAQWTSNSKKNDVAKFTTCTDTFKEGFFK